MEVVLMMEPIVPRGVIMMSFDRLLENVIEPY